MAESYSPTRYNAAASTVWCGLDKGLRASAFSAKATNRRGSATASAASVARPDKIQQPLGLGTVSERVQQALTGREVLIELARRELQPCLLPKQILDRSVVRAV